MVRQDIQVLSKDTIDQIAAGEVVERPASVVKELVENAIDAGSTAITVEIKNGGKSFIRITDNGCGIPARQLSTAFLRHATSKLRNTDELMHIQSLGFRGEALSSISAVSHVEMITKTENELMGSRYVIEGSEEVSLTEVGAPEGTTIMVYQLFYNTPARLKFLKSDTTEASYIAELMERLALSHPDISFCFISSGKEKLHTSGNGNLKDMIYQIYGRDVASNLIEVSLENENYQIAGYVGEAALARGNRSLETFFVQGRFIKSALLSKALESGYAGYLMQHQYPFCVLNVTSKNATVDVNVHPTKQEVRFDDEISISNLLTDGIQEVINHKEDIVEIEISEPKAEASLVSLMERVEVDSQESVVEESPIEQILPKKESVATLSRTVEPFEKKKLAQIKEKITAEIHKDTPYERKYEEFYEQQTFLTEEARKTHRIIGQVFDTYWLVEFDGKLYIIDQHAAHEKVLYEKMMKQLRDKTMTSQHLSPSIIVTLSRMEQQILEEYQDAFVEIGFDISSFGGNEYAINAVPGNLYSLDYKQLFLDLLTECEQQKRGDDLELIKEKIASMSCKAAVKGNNRLSQPEIETLIDDLLSLDNPYHCPHGRPTIISMTKYELEKKFRRIV